MGRSFDHFQFGTGRKVVKDRVHAAEVQIGILIPADHKRGDRDFFQINQRLCFVHTNIPSAAVGTGFFVIMPGA